MPYSEFIVIYSSFYLDLTILDMKYHFLYTHPMHLK